MGGVGLHTTRNVHDAFLVLLATPRSAAFPALRRVSRLRVSLEVVGYPT